MRILVYALVFIACSLPSLAKEKVNISSEPLWLYKVNATTSKKPDLKDVGNGYYLELYDNQVNLVNKTTYTRYIRNIVNESGVQNGSEVSVSYSPLYENVVFHKISVIRDGEIINQLQLKNIKVVQEETDANDFLYNGTKRAFVILKDVRKGDRIDVAYSVTGFNPIYSNRYSGTFEFYTFNPVCNYFQTIIAEPARNLRFTYINEATPHTEERTSSSHIYHWSNPALKSYKYLEGAPSWYNTYPAVTVSDFQNWSEVATWATAVFNDYSYSLPAPLIEKIRKWKVQSENDNDDFIRRALRFVQDDIRYLGMEVGIHTYKPHEPKDVVSKAYGDCKDKALLLTMILKHENIDAYVALVNTMTGAALYKAAANPNEFNHAIVAIRRDNGFLYVDPTMSLQKGELSDNYVPAYGYALLVRDKETNLRKIEPGERNSIYIVETLKANFDDTSTLSVYSLYKGGKAERTRGEFAEVSLNDMKSGYEKFYAPLFENITMVGDISYTDNGDDNSILILEEYRIPKIFTSVDKKKEFNVYAKALHQEMSDKPSATADYPIALKYPTAIQYKLDIEMPENWDFPREDIHIRNDYYQFDFESEVVDNTIKLAYYYKTFSDHIPVSELEQYRKDYEKISAVIEYNLSYTDLSKLAPNNEDNTSWRAVSITFTGFLLMTLLLLWLNRRTIDVEFDRNTGWPIGGWMVVLGVTLCIGLLFNFYNLFYGEYYKNTTWLMLKESGAGLVEVGTLELIANIMRLSFSVAVVIWFFKRRDIFPQMFLWYVGLMFATQLSLYLSYSFVQMPESFGNIKGRAFINLIQTSVYAAMWSAYVQRADRTKVTFLKSS